MIWIECHGERMFWSVENKRWECRHCPAFVEVTKEMLEQKLAADRLRRELREALA